MKSKIRCAGAVKTAWFVATAWLLGANAPANSDVQLSVRHISPAITRHEAPDRLEVGGLHGSSLFAGLPMDFVENVGQEGPGARFVAGNGHLGVLLEPASIKLTLMRRTPLSVSLAFEGASKQSQLIGEEKRKTIFNYYLGNDPSKWCARVPVYGSVLYSGLYKGVDIRLREESGRLEYDLLLAPGADLAQVVIRGDDVSGISLGNDGSLLLETPAGPLRQAAPRTWEQLPGGATRPLACGFRRIDAHRYGFSLAEHESSHAIVIDPGLEWSTFIGGSLGASVQASRTFWTKDQAASIVSRRMKSV